jgi:hypothetical protein
LQGNYYAGCPFLDREPQRLNAITFRKQHGFPAQPGGLCRIGWLQKSCLPLVQHPSKRSPPSTPGQAKRRYYNNTIAKRASERYHPFLNRYGIYPIIA